MSGYQAPGPSRRDSHTRVEYVRDPTYTERLSRSCSGILFGWLILFGAVFLLYWNEGRAVAQYNTIQEGIGMCVSEGFLDEASAPAQAPLIHFTARLAPEQVRDEQFGVKVSAVTLERIVETYQWHEKQDRREYKDNGGKRIETTYSYFTAWSANLIDYTRFDDPHGHENPTNARFGGAVFQSPHVKVGPYVLPPELKSSINAWVALPVAKATLPEGLHVQDEFAVSGDLYSPRVGDVRISFRYNGKKGTEVSIIGKPQGNTIVPYRSQAGNTIELLSMGAVSADDMFSSEEMANTVMTWALRVLGWVLVVMGLSMTNDILYTIADFIPLVRDVISTSLFVINVSLGTTITAVVVAVGWIRFRPWLAIGVVASALTLTYFLITGARKRRASEVPRPKAS